MKIRAILGQVKLYLLGFIYIITPDIVIKHFLKNRNIRWIFIIGSTNSGSTLLQDLLSSHIEISGMMGEGQYRTRALKLDKDRLFGEKKYLFELSEHDDAQHLRVYYDWYFATKGSRKILLEKTPVNSMRMPWLQKWFSPAKFIVIARSPYGVCEGMQRKTGVSIERAANNWNIIYSTILETLSKIDSYMIITYDELTSQTELTLEKIALFLELKELFNDFENKALNIHEQQSKIKNMDFKSINRLTQDELFTINSICGTIMNDIGLRIVNNNNDR